MDIFFGTGWDGILYPAGNGKEKIMIVFSGSEGGLEHAGKCCRYLQDNGIDSFALGYYKTKHASKKLDRIPVEIFDEVIKNLKGMGYRRIGVEGVSKGAELALAAAIRYFRGKDSRTDSHVFNEGRYDLAVDGELRRDLRASEGKSVFLSLQAYCL